VKPTKVILTGAKGRMGQILVACAERNPGVQVVGQIDLGDQISTVIREGDVVVDFSFHEATAKFATLCAENRKALVIGTTGHRDSERAEISRVTSQIPVVWASNYSTGVNTLFWLTRKAAEILGPGFDLEIVRCTTGQKKTRRAEPPRLSRRFWPAFESNNPAR
jgi:4-hydroxy-tetrahydrodipicolinate reductase